MHKFSKSIITEASSLGLRHLAARELGVQLQEVSVAGATRSATWPRIAGSLALMPNAASLVQCALPSGLVYRQVAPSWATMQIPVSNSKCHQWEYSCAQAEKQGLKFAKGI